MNISKFPFLQRATRLFCRDTVFGYISDMTCINDKFCWFRTTENELVIVYADSIVSSIGQTDSDGCNIFEGDIVKVIFDNLDPNEVSEDILVVCYNKDCAAFCLYNKNGKTDEYGICLKFIELDSSFHIHVIGNIYNNPELVEGWENPKEFEI